MKKYWAFYIPYLVFVLGLSVLILGNSKADLHLWLTSFNTAKGDVFFSHYTYVGDWIPYLVAAGLLFYNYKMAIFVTISQIIPGLVSQIIKRTCNEPRPLLYFKEHFPGIQLHQVTGEQLYTMHSFPSGHTTTAFAFFLALSFYTPKKTLHVVYLALAILVGYSRIYLSQHFALDVLAGSVVGVSTTIICKYYFNKNTERWKDGSLLDLFSKK